MRGFIHYAKDLDLNCQQYSELHSCEGTSPSHYSHTETRDKTSDILQYTTKLKRRNTPCAKNDKKNGNMNSKWNSLQNDWWTSEPICEVVLMPGCGFEPRYQVESLKGLPNTGKQQEARRLSKAVWRDGRSPVRK